MPHRSARSQFAMHVVKNQTRWYVESLAILLSASVLIRQVPTVASEAAPLAGSGRLIQVSFLRGVAAGAVDTRLASLSSPRDIMSHGFICPVRKGFATQYGTKRYLLDAILDCFGLSAPRRWCGSGRQVDIELPADFRVCCRVEPCRSAFSKNGLFTGDGIGDQVRLVVLSPFLGAHPVAKGGIDVI